MLFIRRHRVPEIRLGVVDEGFRTDHRLETADAVLEGERPHLHRRLRAVHPVNDIHHVLVALANRRRDDLHLRRIRLSETGEGT